MMTPAQQRHSNINLPHPTAAWSISVLIRSHLVGCGTCSLVSRGSVYRHAGRIRHHVPAFVELGLQDPTFYARTDGRNSSVEGSRSRWIRPEPQY